MHHPEAGIRLQVHRVKDQWSLGNEVAQNMAENITSLGPLQFAPTVPQNMASSFM